MNRIQKNYERFVVASGLLLAASASNAAGLDDLFNAVDLSGIATKITAAGVIIVGIALALKGPAIVKRLISKV